MVICLLMAAAAALWPVPARLAASGARRSARYAAAGGEVLDGPESLPPNGAEVPPRRRGVWGVLMAAGGAVVALFFAMAGVAGATAAGVALATGGVLVRRSLAERRGRTALVDIHAALRMLGRELRAGAEPSAAAGNACAAARGAGVDVLRALTRLTRADDRPSVGGSNAADPRAQVQDRLRSGWLLTRRHGLAFTPLIDALAADLSEQIAAEADRAGQVAGPRMSGYVMAVLPLLGLVLGVGMGADPFRVLLMTPVGNILLLVGVVLTCAGLLWSARIVRR